MGRLTAHGPGLRRVFQEVQERSAARDNAAPQQQAVDALGSADVDVEFVESQVQRLCPEAVATTDFRCDIVGMVEKQQRALIAIPADEAKQAWATEEPAVVMKKGHETHAGPLNLIVPHDRPAWNI